ncbi:hypothetical protein K4K60_006082 [Colletotrichum sp. SAR11_57]|nr:hypothetical protein K4K60_006082 [Colletotrichum sp. SAR11_57]
MPQRGTSLRGGRGGKAAGGAAKRKRDASDAGNMDGIQKRRTDSDSKEEGREWTKQYYQGKSVLDEDMKGMGCGWCRLITPEVPFQSPFACAGNIEVSSGTEGPGGGSIRLCGPKNYFGFNKDGIFDAIFLIPFRHIEEKAVARRKLERMMDPADAGNLNGIQKRRTTSAESREAGCAWEQQYYQGVRSSKFPGLGLDAIFILPFKHVGSESVIERTATLSPPTDSRVKAKTRGQLYLINQGVFFNSRSHRAYLSFDSVEKAMTVLAHDMKDEGKVAGLNLIFRATEPFYNAEDEETESQTLIKFVQVDHTLLDDIKNYMKQHRVELMLYMRSITIVLVIFNVPAIFAACRTVVQPCTNFQTCYALEMQSTCDSNEHVGSGSCQSTTSAANSYVTCDCCT